MSDLVELTEVPQRFERWLAGRPLAQRSRREHARNVRAYCAWLAETPHRTGWQGDPLADPLARMRQMDDGVPPPGGGTLVSVR
jgi:hypothetical protein